MIHPIVSSGKVCDCLEPAEWMRVELRHVKNGWIVAYVDELLMNADNKRGYMYTLIEEYAGTFADAMLIIGDYFNAYTYDEQKEDAR